MKEQIQQYIDSLEPAKGKELSWLHQRIMEILPNERLWFFDGKDEDGKVVSNPNIGYGQMNLPTVKDKNREFYQIGISANSSGISVYVMGLESKDYLKEQYATTIGKAQLSAYCIKFKKLGDIDISILERAIREGYELSKGR
jgi:hypothetical protein